MISETVKFFKQLRHAIAMQGKTMQNKRAKYLNNSVICSVSLTLSGRSAGYPAVHLCTSGRRAVYPAECR